MGTPEGFTSYVEEDAGHQLTAAIWERVRAFFAKHLGCADGV